MADTKLTEINLIRFETSDEGTFGRILVVPTPIFYTAELPWRDNKPDISCLPLGRYLCEWDWSPKRKRNIFFIREDYKDRDAFQIHSGNYVGDTAKKDPKTGLQYKADAFGCILLGNVFLGDSNGGQKMIGDSKAALSRFESLMKQEPFYLNITKESDMSEDFAA